MAKAASHRHYEPIVEGPFGTTWRVHDLVTEDDGVRDGDGSDEVLDVRPAHAIQFDFDDPIHVVIGDRERL